MKAPHFKINLAGRADNGVRRKRKASCLRGRPFWVCYFNYFAGACWS